VGLPLGAIAAIGACWRVFGLLPVAWRELPGVQTSGWVRIWMLLAVGGTLIGAVAMAATLLATFGADLPWSGALRDLWRTVTLMELLTAAVWVAGEALDLVLNPGEVQPHHGVVRDLRADFFEGDGELQGSQMRCELQAQQGLLVAGRKAHHAGGQRDGDSEAADGEHGMSLLRAQG
jgi:hypothetical protein